MPETEPEEREETIPDAEQCEEEYEKTVTMVAYDDDLDFPGLEEWAEQLTGCATTETEWDETEKTYLVFDLGNGEQRTRVHSYQYTEETLEEMRESLSQDTDGRVRIETQVDREQKPVASLSHASSEFLGDLFQESPVTISGGIEKQQGWNRWVTDDKEWGVFLKHASFRDQRVLAKESERSSDDKYETMSEVPAFQFVVEMRAPTEELIDSWTEDVITSLHRLLSQHQDIGKVRYMSCTVTQEKRGECYSI